MPYLSEFLHNFDLCIIYGWHTSAMNVHIISFLADIFVWGLLGMSLGRSVYTQEINNTSKTKTQLVYISIAISSGLFAALANGIPDRGFAYYDFIYVFVITFVYGFFSSPSFRRAIIDKINPQIKIRRINLVQKGGEIIHGNNS